MSFTCACAAFSSPTCFLRCMEQVQTCAQIFLLNLFLPLSLLESFVNNWGFQEELARILEWLPGVCAALDAAIEFVERMTETCHARPVLLCEVMGMTSGGVPGCMDLLALAPKPTTASLPPLQSPPPTQSFRAGLVDWKTFRGGTMRDTKFQGLTAEELEALGFPALEGSK